MHEPARRVAGVDVGEERCNDLAAGRVEVERRVFAQRVVECDVSVVVHVDVIEGGTEEVETERQSDLAEIGRASCRERVYVAVVEVTLYKQRKTVRAHHYV